MLRVTWLIMLGLKIPTGLALATYPWQLLYGVTTSWPGGGCVPACMVASDADLNDDGIVNILDIFQVDRCFGQDPSVIAQCQVTDMNCEGGGDRHDRRLMLRIAANMPELEAIGELLE